MLSKIIDFFTKHPRIFNELLVLYYDLDSNISSFSKDFPFNPASMRKFKDRIDWKTFCKYNKWIRFNDFFPNDYMDFIDWGLLSENQQLKLDIISVDKYTDFWDWKKLSQNICLPWSHEFILYFKEHWDWAELIRNKAIVWDKEMISQHIKKLFSFGNYMALTFCSNENVDWDLALLEKVSEKMSFTDFRRLSSNESVRWSIELLNKYEDSLDWDALSTNPSFRTPDLSQN